MQFIECVKEQEALGVEEPIETAIRICVEKNILANFLKTREKEVLKAMTIDMTFERREELIRRDERAEGRVEGSLISSIRAVTSLMNKMSLSLEQALDALSIIGEEREMVIAGIGENKEGKNTK